MFYVRDCPPSLKTRFSLKFQDKRFFLPHGCSFSIPLAESSAWHVNTRAPFLFCSHVCCRGRLVHPHRIKNPAFISPVQTFPLISGHSVPTSYFLSPCSSPTVTACIRTRTLGYAQTCPQPFRAPLAHLSKRSHLTPPARNLGFIIESVPFLLSHIQTVSNFSYSILKMSAE